MSEETDRLERQLELARSAEVLEAARETMHADRSEENIAAFKEASNVHAGLRTQFRIDFPPPVPEDGDVIVTPETVGAGVEVNSGANAGE